ncbi:MAG: hypothetical protein GY711_16900 [bacterium]|nr:hypothetical protein [bacterium]
MRILALALLAAIPALAAAQEEASRSDLRVLLVGHDPADPKVPIASTATKRTYELYRERTAAWEALLREHFADVRVVHRGDYEASLSDEVDVTIFDARPKRLAPAVRERHGAAGQNRLQGRATYLPSDFSRPALTISENSPGIGEPLGLKLDWL